MCTNYIKAQNQVNNNINNHSSHYSSAEYVERENPLGNIFSIPHIVSNRDTILLSGQIRPSRFRSSITVAKLVLPSKGGRNLYIICKAGSNLAIIVVGGEEECY